MGSHQQGTPSFVGRRVVWRGATQRGWMPVEQRLAILAGTQLAPAAPEGQVELRPGDVGEVTELTAVTSAGHQYAVRFANGYEIETILPSSVATFVDTDTPLMPRRPRYAP